MYVSPDKIAASSKSGVEAILGFAQTQFEALEKIAQLNIESAKEAMVDGAEHVKTLLDAKDPQDLMKLNAAYAQPSLAKAVSYSKSVYDVATSTQAHVTKMIESQAAEMNRTMVSMLDTIAKNSPAGGEAAMGAVKTAMAAMNTAYDSLTRVAKQAAEVVDVNFANAATAAKKAPAKKAS